MLRSMLRVRLGRRQLLLVALAACVLVVSASTVLSEKPLGPLTPTQIEEGIQECDFAKSLAAQKVANAPTNASITSKLFAILFPSSSPAINALLATAYISGPPNFLLALCPPNIDPSSLSIMVAFAVGGLLGDTLFHLLPEIFLGEDEPHKVRFVMLEPNRNLLLGVGILAGLVTFMAMDKALRIATGGEAHSHSHSEPETQPTSLTTSSSTSTSITLSETTLKNRNPSNPPVSSTTTLSPNPPTPPKPEINPSVKLAGLLNLIADFTHNITDGLALSSSFYASPALGATTTMAVFFHEIPHEVGDFALLIQSGFSKQKAMGAQFITAVGAFIGTFIGIFVNEYGGGNKVGDMVGETIGLWGTSLTWGDMLLPFTAGTFLYVGTVAVIPELLENEKGSSKKSELFRTLKQFGAMAVGAGIMIAISWT